MSADPWGDSDPQNPPEQTLSRPSTANTMVQNQPLGQQQQPWSPFDTTQPVPMRKLYSSGRAY